MARAYRYTVDQVANALTEARGLISPAARALGCSGQTVRNYIKKHPTLAEVSEEEREKFIDIAEARLFQKVNEGNVTCIIFALKTVGKHRGYVERREVSGPEGGPLQHEDVSKPTTAQQRREIDQHVAQLEHEILEAEGEVASASQRTADADIPEGGT
jgi:DNA-binding transcriptional MerR regulator